MILIQSTKSKNRCLIKNKYKNFNSKKCLEKIDLKALPSDILKTIIKRRL